MGCCKYFYKVWRPGYGPDFIDPNKAFNFERRMVIIRRLVISLLVLAVLTGLVYLLVRYTNGGESKCPQNATQLSGNSSLNQTTSSGNHPRPQALNQASIYSVSKPELDINHGVGHQDSISEDEDMEVPESGEENPIDVKLESNSTAVIAEDIATILHDSDLALLSIQNVTGSYSNETSDHKHAETTDFVDRSSSGTKLDDSNPNKNTFLSPLNVTSSQESDKPLEELQTPPKNQDNSSSYEHHHLQPQNSSEMWCSSSQQVVECVALSKNFKTITTFASERKQNGTVEGYVMVKMKTNSTVWHPYCHPNWTLEMGYSLCQGLGFQQLLQLQTIDLFQLQQRITKLGKQVSLHLESESKPQDLLILIGNGTSSLEGAQLTKTNTSEFQCEVGFISCN